MQIPRCARDDSFFEFFRSLLGFNVPSLDGFHAEMTAKGVHFSMPPMKQEFGGRLAQFEDSEKARCTVSGG